MKTYVALLRGINVGGKKKIKMAELKISLAKLDFLNITTYIQSGNVVFQSNLIDIPQIENQIKEIILKDFGHEVPTLVRTKEEFLLEKELNPFVNEKSIDAKMLYVTFLKEKPVSFTTNLHQNVNILQDKFQCLNKVIYLLFQNGYSKTKLSNSFWEKKLKIQATTRNWNTVCKISNMLSQYSDQADY